VYISKPCSKYPPIIKTIVLSGFEKVIILLICAVTRLLPIIINSARKIHTYSGLLLPIPFAIRIANMINVNSSIIALMIKFGLPNGIPNRPITIIENKIINT
jgi:hypothetical protein